jgi:carboxylesterase
MSEAQAHHQLSRFDRGPIAIEPSRSALRARVESFGADGLSFFGRGTNGRGVLLVHGVTGSPVEMKYVAKHLHRAGYTVYAPLLAGHGVDMAALRASRWEDWYRSLAARLSWFKDEVDQVFMAGVCVGGLLGLRLALDDPAIKAATVYSPLLVYDGWNTPTHYRYGYISVPIAITLGVSRFITLKERPPFGIKSDRIRRLLAETPDGIRGTLPAFPVETLHQNLRLFREVKNVLPEIRTPTLLVHAREDDLSSPANALYIKDRIGGPCEIQWLTDSYHMVHVDQEHRLASERTRTFFDRAA